MGLPHCLTNPAEQTTDYGETMGQATIVGSDDDRDTPLITNNVACHIVLQILPNKRRIAGKQCGKPPLLVATMTEIPLITNNGACPIVSETDTSLFTVETRHATSPL
jgi:hypothetical protein